MLTVRNFALTDKELDFVVGALASHINAHISEEMPTDKALERRLMNLVRDLQFAQRECLHPSER